MPHSVRSTGFPILREVAVVLEVVAALDVHDVGAAVDRVGPSSRATCPGSRSSESKASSLASAALRVVSPIQGSVARSARSAAIRFLHHRVGAAPWPPAESSRARRPCPSAKPRCAVGRRHAALPARPRSRGSVERLAVEIEVLVDELRREARRRGVNEVPAQVRLPLRQRRRDELLVDGLEELRLADVDRGDRGSVDLLENTPSRRSSASAASSRDAHAVVGRVRDRAARRGSSRLRRRLRLERHDGLRVLPRPSPACRRGARTSSRRARGTGRGSSSIRRRSSCSSRGREGRGRPGTRRR